MATTWSPQAVALLADADLLLLVADALRPSPWPAREAGGPDLRADHAADLARACGLDADATAALLQVASLLPQRAAGLAGEYTRLFEAGGCCPPNETAYVRRDKGAVLADLCGFYRAFGFDPAPGTGEKADHVVTELQFMALLLVLAARAVGGGARADRNRAVTVQALEAFAADHPAAWLPSLVIRLRETAAEPLLLATAALLPAAWSAVARLVELPDLAVAAVLEPRAEPPEPDWPCHAPGP